MSWKVHVISLFLLIFTVGAVKFIWDNPKIILYIVMSIIAVLAYGAIYIMVKARMEGQEKK